MCMGGAVCQCVPWVHGFLQRLNWGSDLLELETQAVMSYHVGSGDQSLVLQEQQTLTAEPVLRPSLPFKCV